MLLKAYVIVRDFSRQMKIKNISAFSASTAFFFFLSLMPMVILICTIIPYTPLTQKNLMEAIADIMPERIDSLVSSIVDDMYEKSAGVMSVAAITTLWSAGKGMLALMRGLNAVHDVVEERNYFLVRLISSFYTFVMLIMVVLSLFIMVFGSFLINVLLKYVPQLEGLFGILEAFRFVVVWLVLAVLFMGIYAYVPNRKLSFWEQMPGAVFTAVVWSVFSWGFSLYVNHTGIFSTYGSLAIIVIVMLWLYFCMYIVMIGAHINRYCGPARRRTK